MNDRDGSICDILELQTIKCVIEWRLPHVRLYSITQALPLTVAHDFRAVRRSNALLRGT